MCSRKRWRAGRFSASGAWGVAAALCLVVGGLLLGPRLAAQGATPSARAATVPPLAGELVSVRATAAPIIDGELEPVWQSAPVTEVVLSRRSSDTGDLVVEMRSVHTRDTVYFIASWADAAPALERGVIRNQLTMHFDKEEPWPGARDVTCLVACHTAFVDGEGQLSHLIAETIPPGQTDSLPAQGGWSCGRWHIEWSRPLEHQNLFDVQFDDLSRSYPFFLKVFERVEGRADPVSATYVLVFRD